MASASSGVAIGLVGVHAFLTEVPARQWLGVSAWLGGVVVAHDAVIAPAAVLVGLTAFAVVPRSVRPPLRVAALAMASVALIGIPLIVTR